MSRNNPNHKVWFVDLTPDSNIKRRVVPSSARHVAALGRNNTRHPNTARCIPDDTDSRFWIYAESPEEALYEARSRAAEKSLEQCIEVDA